MQISSHSNLHNNKIYSNNTEFDWIFCKVEDEICDFRNIYVAQFIFDINKTYCNL
jgi:hypothetical protein